MNEKAQALVDALRGVGISVTHWTHSDGDVQIEINRREPSDENTHFSWRVGSNKGFAFVIGVNGQIKDITE